MAATAHSGRMGVPPAFGLGPYTPRYAVPMSSIVCNRSVCLFANYGLLETAPAEGTRFARGC